MVSVSLVTLVSFNTLSFVTVSSFLNSWIHLADKAFPCLFRSGRPFPSLLLAGKTVTLEGKREQGCRGPSPSSRLRLFHCVAGQADGEPLFVHVIEYVPAHHVVEIFLSRLQLPLPAALFRDQQTTRLIGTLHHPVAVFRHPLLDLVLIPFHGALLFEFIWQTILNVIPVLQLKDVIRLQAERVRAISIPLPFITACTCRIVDR
jgi:hypothetical protein